MGVLGLILGDGDEFASGSIAVDMRKRSLIEQVVQSGVFGFSPLYASAIGSWTAGAQNVRASGES